MKINSNIPNMNANEGVKSKPIQTHFTEKISKDEAMELKAQIVQQANDMMLRSTTVQSSLASNKNDFASIYEGFQSFLQDIGYEGKPIAELSQSEAAELISEDGIFGIKQTSQRIANFVINGAGGDEDRLRAGREGMLAGFKQAEEMWGEKLPEISQKTMQAAIEMVDKAFHEAGYSVMDTEA